MDSDEHVSKIAIQYLLSNVSDELFALGGRLQDVEAILFAIKTADDLRQHQTSLQDMDLIIQQINDLARAINVVSDVELEDAQLPTSALGSTLHLNDLRQRLLGISEDRVLSAPEPSADVLLF